MSGLLELLGQLGWRDGVDIILVALLVYNLFLLVRGTRAVQVIVGILLLVAAYMAASLAALRTLQTTLAYVFTFLPFAIIVLFQDEIRRALAQVGRRTTWGFQAPEDIDQVFSEVVLAASGLSQRRIGALIVFERLEGLKNYIENGVPLDAKLSTDLLLNLFNPSAPLHDGAAIIQDRRLAAAACFLPLTVNPELSREHGTRHRAALGISEQTDALAVVVSEETGHISTAFQGRLVRRLSPNDLRNALYKHLVTELLPQPGARSQR